jgi:putative transposase
MRTWPHAPSKAVTEPGPYSVTASTYHKEHHFREDDRLAYLHDCLVKTSEDQGWRLEAWADFSNHYHIVGTSPKTANPFHALTKRVHMKTGHYANNLDEAPGRQVWYRSWDTLITYEKSYLARLAYVHQNAVRHGLVQTAEDYPYCSAPWFFKTAPKAFRDTVLGFKIDRVNVFDDF